MKNQTLFAGALDYYNRAGYTYIELGDGDELWENRRIGTIIEVHSDAFWRMAQMYKAGRFHMIYGNHDIVKKRKNYADKNCQSFYCEPGRVNEPLFPGLKIEEAIILENTELNKEILLVHGHQGSLLNDECWPLARFLVRYVWNPLELAGFANPTGAGRSHREKEAIELQMDKFAQKRDILLVAGHTHRPVFPSPGEGKYFNDGSCVHPRCITGIEIEHNRLTLVKWSIGVSPEETLFVGRQILEGPEKMTDFFV
jgi:predicted phosphodiesterase